ncbi:MAG: hypothetical protein M3297_14665 [Thermoproteota archaeon]|nr:hypothetical protein [Thermoproteota archaeon]
MNPAIVFKGKKLNEMDCTAKIIKNEKKTNKSLRANGEFLCKKYRGARKMKYTINNASARPPKRISFPNNTNRITIKYWVHG